MSQRTEWVTEDGLRVWDADPAGYEDTYIAGPEGETPSGDELSEGLNPGWRWVENREVALLMSEETPHYVVEIDIDGTGPVHARRYIAVWDEAPRVNRTGGVRTWGNCGYGVYARGEYPSRTAAICYAADLAARKGWVRITDEDDLRYDYSEALAAWAPRANEED